MLRPRSFPRPAAALLLGLALGCLQAWAGDPARPKAPPLQEQVQQALKQLAPHPRLFWGQGGPRAVRQRVQQNEALRQAERFVLARADDLLSKPPAERKMIGRRLLAVSRDVRARIELLGYAFGATGLKRYADRGIAEALNAAAFTDWNPTHFLDTAEMASALGVAYDWFHAELSTEQRKTIRTALVQRAFTPALEKEHSWITATTNWNQVCNGGLLIAALAVADDEPEVATRIITQSVRGLPRAMRAYGPDGAYPEGPGYWGYGTTFNVRALAALESALGQDFGLAATPGFLRTADYLLHVVGPSGNWFNYCDCSDRAPQRIDETQWWLADRLRRPELLWHEHAALRAKLAKLADRDPRKGGGFAPLLLLWARPTPTVPEPRQREYVAGGITPVALFRSDWGPEAAFVGIKAGSPRSNHGHMDVGSFVMDRDGVRWAGDLGMQNYESLESKGVKLWDMRQDSQRWQVFRIGASAHNIPTVAGRGQAVASQAEFVRHGPGWAVLDFGSAYAGQLAAARRGARLVKRAVRIQDEFVSPRQPTTLRWAFVTAATVGDLDGPRLRLTQQGKSLDLEAHTPLGDALRWTAIPAQGPHEYDAENPGMQVVSFELPLEPGASATIAVDFGAVATPLVPLDRWDTGPAAGRDDSRSGAATGQQDPIARRATGGGRVDSRVP